MRWGIAIALLAAAACAGRTGQNTIAITHVSVIDVASGATHPDNTVLVTGNRITYVGPAASAKIPSGATVIDGRGKFLIPGLWDMHVHGFVWVFSEFAGPLMIANGVTGARDMGWYIDTTLRWRSDIAAGREIGPRLVAGARVDGPVSKARFVAHVVTEEDGVRAVDTLSQKKDGSRRADFIKTYSWVSSIPGSASMTSSSCWYDPGSRPWKRCAPRPTIQPNSSARSTRSERSLRGKSRISFYSMRTLSPTSAIRAASRL